MGATFSLPSFEVVLYYYDRLNVSFIHYHFMPYVIQDADVGFRPLLYLNSYAFIILCLYYALIRHHD